MIGENTVVLTPNGFKNVSELNKYDEVMTGFGTFEPIIEMGPWEMADKCVEFNTGECIYCSDDLLFNIGSNDTKFAYADELCADDNVSTTQEFDCYCKKILYPAYDFSVVVPTCVPVEYLTSSLESRLKFMSGLIDSPICEVSSDGIYCFYTRYIELITGIVSLARSLGWQATVTHCLENVYMIKVYMDSHADELFVKDICKQSIRNSMRYHMMKVVRVMDASKSGVKCRKIKVNGGSLLLGYSFIPVS